MLKSIRWRLPLTYAAIALVATLALGVVLLSTLRNYYVQREFEQLSNNANAVSMALSRLYAENPDAEQIERRIRSLSIFVQSRIQLRDLRGLLLADSGRVPQQSILFENPNASASGDVLYVLGDEYWVITGNAPVAQPSADGRVSPFPAPTAVPSDPVVQNRHAQQNGAPEFFFSVSTTPWGVNLSPSTMPMRWISDQRVRTMVYDAQGNPVGFIELFESPAHGMEILVGVWNALLQAGTIAVIVAAAVGWFMSRQLVAPVLRLTETTDHMAKGNLAVRSVIQRSDEIGSLSRAFNEMADRVEETVLALRRFIADAAHELHTPLTALRANLELAVTEPDEKQRLLFVERALVQLKRLESLTSGLLDLSRLEAGAGAEVRAKVNLVALARDVCELYASRAEQAGLSLEFEAPDAELYAQVNEAQFRRALGNLLDNAIKFTPENGLVAVLVCSMDGTHIELRVNDTGIGINAEDMPLIFNRFHRARNAAAYPGSGLGLAIIKTIIEGHGGGIAVTSSPAGTQFSLRIPAV